MEKSVARNIRLGLFVITGTALLVAAVYFVGQKQSMFGNSSQLYAVFHDINGLRPGNNIRYSGINVGSVKEISMVSDTIIVVRFGVKNDILPHIRKNAHAIITTDGLVGNMIVNILPGSSSGLAVKAGDTIMSFARVRTDEMLTTLSVTNENAALLTAELLKITREISSGKGVIGSLIKDTTITIDLKETIHHLRHTTESSHATLTKINRLITSLDKNNNIVGTLRDTTLPVTIRQTLANLERSSKQLVKVMDNVNGLIGNADSTITNIRKGEGAINYLSNDPALVTKIDHTVSSLDSALMKINDAGVKLNENLEALKHNWFFKGYFKKLEKEQKKKAGKN